MLSPVTGVVIVPHSGEKAHFSPSAFPVDDYLNRRASGDWPPRSRALRDWSSSALST
ncbi:hypothetical protein [Streptomyces sp. NPDC051636]|uniref:hypothetical protein n=1 Tax=Streptomyces sp. NPDC051636 TaxID=3365663 RepID=UPI003796FC89